MTNLTISNPLHIQSYVRRFVHDTLTTTTGPIFPIFRPGPRWPLKQDFFDFDKMEKLADFTDGESGAPK